MRIRVGVLARSCDSTVGEGGRARRQRGGRRWVARQQAGKQGGEAVSVPGWATCKMTRSRDSVMGEGGRDSEYGLSL